MKRKRKENNKCESTSLGRAEPILPRGAPRGGAPLGPLWAARGPVKWSCSRSVSENCPEDDAACVRGV